MDEPTSYSVSELAAVAGVSVRTLHHYDAIGLLRPNRRSAKGYRRYDRDDAERLFRILIYRELGFDLTGIAGILDDPSVDPREQLGRQRELLVERVGRLQRMLRGVEAMMNAKRNGFNLTPDEMRDVFGSFDPTEHAAEVEERWGDTRAYEESAKRTSSYGKEDWERIKAEGDSIEAEFAEAMRAGAPATGDLAMAVAERHRRHIGRWFYDCDYAMHRGLAEMYITDPRFAEHYDRREPGLSRYVHDAIHANADRAGS